MDCPERMRCLPPYVALAFLVACALSWLPALAESPRPPFEIASPASRAVQKWTGLSALGSATASLVASILLSHEVSGCVKVKVKSYSLTDLLGGKVKGVEVRLSGSSYKGVPLGNVSIRTASPLWVRIRKKNGQSRGLAGPVLVMIDGRVCSEDLKSALASNEVAGMLRMVKLDLPGLGVQHLQLLRPEVGFAKQRVCVKTLLLTRGAAPDTGVTLTVAGRPVLQGDRLIVLEDMEISSPDIPNPREFASFADKLLNPLVDFGRMDRMDRAFRLVSLRVGEDRIDFSGKLLVAPRVTQVQVAEKVKP